MRARGPGALRALRREGPLALLMFCWFFLVIATFWVLKPLKKGLLIRAYDRGGAELGGLLLSAAQVELLAKVANLAVAAAATAVFAWLAARHRRGALAVRVVGFFVAGHAAFAWLLIQPSEPVAWAFYLYGDLFSTLMVATFFACLNDSVSPDAARRLYGPIGLGGVLGGVFGATSVAAALDRVGRPTWLLACAAAGLLTLAVAAWSERFARPHAPAAPAVGSGAAAPSRLGLGGSVRLVARSPYLLSLVAVVACYEVVSTTLDFQFTSVVARHLDGDAIDAHFAGVFAATNWVAVGVQLLVTPLVLTRLGVGAALVVLPALLLGLEGAFLAAPALGLASALSVSDNGLSYSLQQSAREALYVPTTREEKYQAKAVIDMLVQRLAKVAAVVATLGLTLYAGPGSSRWLALPLALVLWFWLGRARDLGRRYRERSREPAS